MQRIFFGAPITLFRKALEKEFKDDRDCKPQWRRFTLRNSWGSIPIVYMPGGFSPLEQGRLMAERLAALGHKVLLWDRPNTG
jgi:hypothetical protein